MSSNKSMHYASSDWHLDHFRALELNARPFTTLEAQADAFFAEANALPDNATLYLLGDLVIRDSVSALETFLQRFKSTLNLVFIPGNHDHRLAKVYAKYGLCTPYLEISHQLQKLCLMHFPLTEWNRGQYGSIHLFGHCHGRYEHPGRALDVGWDVEQRIFSLDELIAKALRKPIYQPCHDKNNGLLTASDVRG